MVQRVKNPPAMQETRKTRDWSLGQEDPLQEEMATHSSILTWEIPWSEEPGGLQLKGSQRVGHDQTKHACTSMGKVVKMWLELDHWFTPLGDI